MRIQSVKEYEEQLNTLMKENFNLKLRIFFLEEKMGRILSGPKDMEEAVKQNIELNVSMNILKTLNYVLTLKLVSSRSKMKQLEKS